MGFLFMYLLGVLTAVGTKNNNSKNANSKTAKDKSDSDSPICVMCLPPPETDQEIAAQKKKKRRETIRFWVEIGGIAVLMVYTGTTVLTYLQIKRSEQTSTQQFRADQRAWISYSWPYTSILGHQSKAGHAIETIDIKNFGKTPARQVHANVVSVLLAIEQEPTFDYPNQPLAYFIEGVIFPNESDRVEVYIHETADGKFDFVRADDLRRKLDAGTHYVIFYGQIGYLDVFGVPHSTRFCSSAPGSKVTGLQLAAFARCIQYNEVDNNQ